MSVKMALAKLCACACGGAVLGGGAVHVVEKPRPAVVQSTKGKSVKLASAKPIVRHRPAIAAAPCAPSVITTTVQPAPVPLPPMPLPVQEIPSTSGSSGTTIVPTGSSGEKVTITFTAAYAIGADSVNKDQGWVVMQYLAGLDGMQKWTEGGIAVPSRTDVPVPDGFDVIVAGAEYARPGSGFMPGYPDVQKAFGDAFLKEITDGTYSADAVVTATKTKIDEVLAQ